MSFLGAEPSIEPSFLEPHFLRLYPSSQKVAKGVPNHSRPRFYQKLEADIAEGISEGLVQGTTDKCWFRQAHTGTDATRSSGCVESL